MRYASKEDLIPIAKEYCRRIGAEFLFVNDDATCFGYEDKKGFFVKKTFYELAEELEKSPV